MNDKLVLTIREVAKILGVTEQTLWKWTCPRGDLPCVKMGKLVRYRPQDLEEWIETKRIGKAASTNKKELQVEEKSLDSAASLNEEVSQAE